MGARYDPERGTIGVAELAPRLLQNLSSFAELLQIDIGGRPSGLAKTTRVLPTTGGPDRVGAPPAGTVNERAALSGVHGDRAAMVGAVGE